jgi:hypothetical protein
MVLSHLGLQSVERQHDVLNALLSANLRLCGEKLAAEIERRTRVLAETALRDAA